MGTELIAVLDMDSREEALDTVAACGACRRKSKLELYRTRPESFRVAWNRLLQGGAGALEFQHVIR